MVVTFGALRLYLIKWEESWNFKRCRAELDQWRQAKALLVETNLLQRAAALDFISFVRAMVYEQAPISPAGQALLAAAETLATTLTQINDGLFTRLRQGVAAGDTARRRTHAYIEQFTNHRPTCRMTIFTLAMMDLMSCWMGSLPCPMPRADAHQQPKWCIVKKRQRARFSI